MVELSYPDPELSDGTTRLRRWRETDLGCLEEAATDPRIAGGTTLPPVFTTAAGVAFVRRQWSRLPMGVAVSQAVARAHDDRAVGLAVLTPRPQPGVAGVGYWIVPSARGRGHATAAARLLADWGLGTLGFQRVEAWVEHGNEPSRRALLAAGFELEGRLRNFLSPGGTPTDALVLSRI